VWGIGDQGDRSGWGQVKGMKQQEGLRAGAGNEPSLGRQTLNEQGVTLGSAPTATRKEMENPCFESGSHEKKKSPITL